MKFPLNILTKAEFFFTSVFREIYLKRNKLLFIVTKFQKCMRVYEIAIGVNISP